MPPPESSGGTVPESSGGVTVPVSVGGATSPVSVGGATAPVSVGGAVSAPVAACAASAGLLAGVEELAAFAEAVAAAELASLGLRGVERSLRLAVRDGVARLDGALLVAQGRDHVLQFREELLQHAARVIHLKLLERGELVGGGHVLLPHGGGRLGIDGADGGVGRAADLVGLGDEVLGRQRDRAALAGGPDRLLRRGGLVVTAAALDEEHEDDEKGDEASKRHKAPAHVDVHFHLAAQANKGSFPATALFPAGNLWRFARGGQPCGYGADLDTGDQGLEPRLRIPETRVLPITPIPIGAT